MVDPTLRSFSNAINSPSSFLVLSCLMMAYTAHMCSLWHELWNIFNFPYWWNVLFSQWPFWYYFMCILNIVKTNIYPGNLCSKDDYAW